MSEKLKKYISEYEKREKVYAVLNTLSVETISNVFKAAKCVANSPAFLNDNRDNILLSKIKQENEKNQITIAASNIELAAYT